LTHRFQQRCCRAYARFRIHHTPFHRHVLPTPAAGTTHIVRWLPATRYCQPGLCATSPRARRVIKFGFLGMPKHSCLRPTALRWAL
jgi:hypothetical protein